MRGKPSETNELSFARTELHKGYFANGELIFLIEPSFFFLCALIALRRSSCVNFLLFDDIFTRLIPTTNQLQLTIYRLSLGLAQNAYRTLYNVSRNESRNNNSESQSRERNCHIVTSHRTHHTHTTCEGETSLKRLFWEFRDSFRDKILQNIEQNIFCE